MQGKYPLTDEDGFKLKSSHKMYWMEAELEKRLGYVSDEHEQEHWDMMDHFGLKFRNLRPLNGPISQDGKDWCNRRAYHCELHLKYWKAKGMHLDLVEKYENEIGSLENIQNPGLIDG